MKSLVLLVALVISSNMAMAEGGKKGQTTLYDVYGDSVGTVIPVPEGCEVIVPQSGKAVYVMCDIDEKT